MQTKIPKYTKKSNARKANNITIQFITSGKA